MLRQKPRLIDNGWKVGDVVAVESDYKAFLKSFQDEPALKEILDRRSVKSSNYDVLWCDCTTSDFSVLG